MADDLAWETLDTELDYCCPGFDVRRDEVRFPDGTETDFHYVDEPAAVVVLPFLADDARAVDADDGGDDRDGDTLVTIEEWRQAVGRVNHGVPAGSLEPEDGDDLEAAAERELAEETGHEAESFERLCTVEPANGFANSVHHHLVARGCRPTASQRLDHNESIRVTTTGYDELLAAVRDDEVRDARTVTSVLRYELGRR